MLATLPLALILLCGGADEDTQTSEGRVLDWKFTEGRALHLLSDEKRRVEELGDNARLIGDYSNLTDFQWVIEKVNEDGSAQIKQTIERLRLRAEAPQGNVEYDSSDPATHQGQGQQVHASLGKLVGGSFTYNLTPAGDVSAVEPTEELTARFEDAPIPMRGIISSKMLAYMIPMMRFSDRPIPKDGAWVKTITLPEMPIGTRTSEATYTLGPIVEQDGVKLQQIDITEKPNFVPKQQQPGVSFQLKDVTRSGTALFNTEEGQLVSRTQEESFTIVVDAGPNHTEQRSTSTTTTTFSKPADNGEKAGTTGSDEK